MTTISDVAKANTQLDAIYSMMDNGQHSVKMERHTLLIWGITAAILILLTDLIFNKEALPVRWQLITFQTIFISTVLFLAGFLDFKFTRKIRLQRDESLSFIQLQLTKVWWFFVGFIVVLNVGMNFFGGGYMFYGLTLVLMGMAFYVYGLFSTQMLKWVGFMLVTLGLLSVALNLHFLATKWLAAGVFGLGFPSLAYILNKPAVHSTLIKRLSLSAIWLAIVIFPSMLAYQNELRFDATGLITRNISEYKSLSLEQASKRQIIHIPAGTDIPININMTGNIVEMSKNNRLKMRLKKDIQVLVEDGKTNGQFKVEGGEWLNRISHLRTKNFKMASNIQQHNGPAANVDFSLEIK